VCQAKIWDGRGAEDETVVAIRFSELVPFWTYQTALGPQCENPDHQVLLTECLGLLRYPG
jgi:hypothetical protein